MIAVKNSTNYQWIFLISNPVKAVFMRISIIKYTPTGKSIFRDEALEAAQRMTRHTSKVGEE
jgi:hypothetical protein